jgi:hypothetical protein
MSDYLNPIAAAVLAFWHALSSSEKTTIIAASVASITTILTATIGALVVLWQIGRQAGTQSQMIRGHPGGTMGIAVCAISAFSVAAVLDVLSRDLIEIRFFQFELKGAAGG